MKRTLPLFLLACCAVAPLAAQTTHTVTVGNFFFDNPDLPIEVGDTVVWQNDEGFHNVDGSTATFPANPEAFGNVAAGAPWTYSFTFTLAGAYGYLCEVHPAQMQGTVTVTAASSTEDEQPAGFALSLLTPNPFRSEATFTLTTARTERVRIAVYDVRGREVKVLHDGALPGGTPQAFVWAPTTLHAGVYLLRVQGETFRATRKMVYVR